jgi:hypothetical protein
MHGSPVFLIHIQGSATSEFGYSYEMEEMVTVRLTLKGEDELVPVTSVATEEDLAQAEQHGRDLACKEYGELMHIANVGAYIESSEDGSYWYPDEEGQNISARITELDSAALEEGLHFALTQDGKSYILESATQEELDAYAEAKARSEEDEDEEGVYGDDIDDDEAEAREQFEAENDISTQ